MMRTLRYYVELHVYDDLPDAGIGVTDEAGQPLAYVKPTTDRLTERHGPLHVSFVRVGPAVELTLRWDNEP